AAETARGAIASTLPAAITPKKRALCMLQKVRRSGMRFPVPMAASTQAQAPRYAGSNSSHRGWQLLRGN
ncbi:MAG: hypothetical protein ACYDFV_09720, partial [Vulcanimicrobiaceae bacterium]